MVIVYYVDDELWLKDNQTALHTASRVGDVAVVELLISQGASVNAVTSDLYTPLHIAAKEGHDDVASLLLTRGASNAPTTKANLIYLLNYLSIVMLTLLLPYGYSYKASCAKPSFVFFDIWAL